MSNTLSAAVITALANRGVTTQSGKGTPIVETLTGIAKPSITNTMPGVTSKEAIVEKPAYVRVFNKIVLTLENSLIPEEKLEKTPSYTDGLDPETETDLRILGCELIQTAGILLKLPQVAMATGQVLFQRFFYSKSFVRHNMETVAMSCLCLASKIEEAPRRIRDVMNVFHHIKQVRAQKDISPMIVDQNYTNLKTQVIKAERRVLKELGFCVHVKHPHKLIVMYLQVLKYEGNEKLMQMSWNFMNDSLRTDVFMRHQPETIACACIYLSARKLGIVLPKSPPWFAVFRVNEDDIISICYRVMELYIREKVNVEKLEHAVDELKKRYAETRNKLKEANTLTATTTVDRNNGSHNAWGGFIQRAVPVPLHAEKQAERNSRSRSRSRHSRSVHSHNSRSQSGSPRQRSHSRTPRARSRTNSRSNSRSGSEESITYKKSKKTAYAERKRKSRHYSRSHSCSPYEKQRKRKSSRTRDRERERETNNYGVIASRESRVSLTTNEKYRDRDRERDRERERERHERDRDRDASRSTHRTSSKHYSHSHHHRSYNHGSHYNSSSGGNLRSNNTKHYDTDRPRDRKR